MKKPVKIVISIVLAVWIFAMGIEIGAYRERKAINASIVTPSVSAPANTNAPTSPVPDSTAPQPDTTAPTEGSGTTAPPQSTDTTDKKNDEKPSLPKSKEDICAAFNQAMNNTKNATKNCNAHKKTDIQITVVDCSVPSITNIVNKVVQGFVGVDEADFAFVGGVTSDGKKINGELAPANTNTSISAAGVSSASCEAYGNGGQKITLKIVPETSSLGNIPPHHSASVGYLDLGSLDLPVNITQADMEYAGATVTITVTADGLVDTYHCDFPMRGTGSGNKLGLSGSATFEGAMIEDMTFAWA